MEHEDKGNTALITTDGERLNPIVILVDNFEFIVYAKQYDYGISGGVVMLRTIRDVIQCAKKEVKIFERISD